jgi:hypothetical protein
MPSRPVMARDSAGCAVLARSNIAATSSSLKRRSVIAHKQ